MSKVSPTHIQEVIEHTGDHMGLLWIGKLRGYKALDDLLSAQDYRDLHRSVMNIYSDYGHDQQEAWNRCAHHISKYFNGNVQYGEEYLQLEQTRSQASRLFNTLCELAAPDLTNEEKTTLLDQEENHTAMLKRMLAHHGEVRDFMAEVAVEAFVTSVRRDLGIPKPLQLGLK